VANPTSKLVFGYVSHGIHGGAPRDYLANPANGVNFQLANGAVFASWESYNAKTFSPDVNVSQGLVAEWIARGGTVGVGHVAEPSASSITVAREDALFDRLLRGMSWVEAAWGANYQLSFVNTVVGDPLMQFQPWLPGDLDMSGDVDDGDLAIMLGKLNVTPGHLGFYDGDLTGDASVSDGDLNILLINFHQSPLATIASLGGGFTAASLPEPTTSTVMGIAVLAALACYRRRSRSTYGLAGTERLSRYKIPE
jgi:hypothetical protein